MTAGSSATDRLYLHVPAPIRGRVVRDRTSARGSAGADRRRPKRVRLVIAGVFLLSSLVLAPAAEAATCTYNDVTRRVDVQIGSDEAAALAVDSGAGFDDVGSEGSILFRQGEGGYADCDGATNDNTTVIVVHGQEASSESFSIDEQSGVSFATVIAWAIDLGSGEADTFTITASDADNSIVFGADSFSLNGGGGDLVGVELVNALGSVGDDRIDASGRSNSTRVEGGDGSDTLIGGTASDGLFGDDDDDRLIGGPGNDVLDGGPNEDTLYGGDGTDTCILDDVRQPCDPSISVDPPSVTSGGSLTVTGAGWYPENGLVGFTLDPSGDGSFTGLQPDQATWSIDGTAIAPSAADGFTVTACQPCTDQEADRALARFAVATNVTTQTVQPSVTTLDLDPAEGGPGDVVTVSGEGWDRANGKVRIFLNPSASKAEPVRVRPDPDSTFEVRLDIPDLDDGSYTVLACQRCNRAVRLERTATLTVATGLPAWSTWLLILLAAVLVIGVASAVVSRGIRLRERRLLERIETVPRLAEPQVQPVSEERDGSPHHRVELIPRSDAGVQRVSGRSPRE